MSYEVGTAYVTLVPSAKGFASKMQSELGGDLARYGQQGGDTYGRGFSDGGRRTIASRAKGMFGGMARGGMLAGAVAGAAIGKVLFDSIGAASDLDEVLAKSSQIFGKGQMPALEAWANGAASAMGQSKQQALDAASTFAIFGKSAGLSGKELVGFSQDFTGLASDLASFHNASPEEAITAIGAALRGETEPIRRFGVMLDDASMREEALRLGLIKTTKDALTPQQKALAAQALIFKQTKDAQGDFTRTSGGLANQQRILSAQWADMKTKIGQGLLPVALKLVSWANDLMPKMAGVAKVVQAEVGPALEAVKGFVSGLFSGGGGSADIAEWVAVFRSAFNDVRDIVSTGIDIIVALWENGTISRVVEIVRSAFTAVRDIIAGAFRIIRGIFNVVAGLLTGDWSRVWTGIKQILSGAWKIIVAIVRHLWTQLRVGFAHGGALLRGIMARAWDGIKALVRLGITALVNYVKGIPGRWRAALSVVGAVLRAVFSAAWNGARNLVSNAADGIVDFVRGIPGRLRNLGSLFGSAGKAIIDKFVDGMKNAAGVVSGIAGNVWDAVRGLINDAINKINSALEFEISIPGPNIHINPTNIPQLATGGRATAATLAVIGEGAEPETVLPDSVLRGLLERAHAAGAGAAGPGGRALLTITNWRDGVGYFRMVADGSVADEAAYQAGLGGMGRA